MCAESSNVFGPHGAGQPVGSVVGKLDCFVFSGEGVRGQDRAKDLLPDHGGIWANGSEDSGLDEEIAKVAVRAATTGLTDRLLQRTLRAREPKRYLALIHSVHPLKVPCLQGAAGSDAFNEARAVVAGVAVGQSPAAPGTVAPAGGCRRR
jgi:hypothetical protein